MDDDGLLHLLNSVAPRSIVLVEDIDAAFPDGRTTLAGGSYGRAAAHQGQASAGAPHHHAMHQHHIASHDGITFSGLLNALDGVSARYSLPSIDYRVEKSGSHHPPPQCLLRSVFSSIAASERHRPF